MKSRWRLRLENNRGWLITIAAFVLVASVVWLCISSADRRVTEAQAQTLRDALRSAAVNGYAIEGRYPTLDEIKENYLVTISDEDFAVTYEQFASNVMPYISVEIRKAVSK